MPGLHYSAKLLRTRGCRPALAKSQVFTHCCRRARRQSEDILSAITDQLNQHLDKMDAEGGLSALHLLSLPSSINRVLRLFLRSKQIDYEDLRKAIDGMPADNRLSYEELDEMLNLLCSREWLVRSEEGSKTFYGINLRPAVASASAKASTTSDN